MLLSEPGNVMHLRESLCDRMERRLKVYNNNQVHPYKPFVVYLQSADILKYVNTLSDVQNKTVDLGKNRDILEVVCRELYKTMNPTVIYTFGNEITLVYYYNEMGDLPYNGNVNKFITKAASIASVYYAMAVQQPVTFTGRHVEFNKDYEVLNWLVWRQNDCKRNHVQLLYKCLYKNEILNGHQIDNKKMEEMMEPILETIKYEFITGYIMKKELCYKYDEKDNINKRFTYEFHNVQLSDNFRENLRKYIMNKYL